MAQVRASQRTDGQRSGAAFAVATAAIGALGARLHLLEHYLCQAPGHLLHELVLLQ